MTVATETLYQIADELRALACLGLTYTTNEYDRERYTRILAASARLVTAQVGSRTNLDIHRLLGAPLSEGPDWDLAIARAALETRGFRVHRADEFFPITRYADLGALVWYLKAIPWQIPDFTVDSYADRLVALHHQVERTKTPIDVGFHLFLLVAQR